MLDDWSGDVQRDCWLSSTRRAAGGRIATPEEWTISVEVDEPGWVIVSQLARPAMEGPLDRPGWTGRVTTARSCRPFAERRNPGAGSVSRFPRRAAGRYGWNTRRATWRKGRRSRSSHGSRGCWRRSSTALQAWRGTPRAVARSDRGMSVTTKIGVAIVGASGYAARELIRILLSHPHVGSRLRHRGRTRRRGWTRCIPAWRGGST